MIFSQINVGLGILSICSRYFRLTLYAFQGHLTFVYVRTMFIELNLEYYFFGNIKSDETFFFIQNLLNVIKGQSEKIWRNMYEKIPTTLLI